MERNLPYSPPYAQLMTRTPAPSVAGHPATDNQHRHPLNNKKSGPDSVKSEKPLARRHRLQYNTNKANNKGRT